MYLHMKSAVLSYKFIITKFLLASEHGLLCIRRAVCTQKPNCKMLIISPTMAMLGNMPNCLFTIDENFEKFRRNFPKISSVGNWRHEISKRKSSEAIFRSGQCAVKASKLCNCACGRGLNRLTQKQTKSFLA